MKIRLRLFWSYDVIKTQHWLEKQSKLGLVLIRFLPVLSIFIFKRTDAEKYPFLIIYDKNSRGCPIRFTESNDFKEVLNTRNYYFLQQLSDKPDLYPSYEALLNKNSKIKYVVGVVLLFISSMYFLFFVAIFSSIFTGSFSFEWGGWDPLSNYSKQEIIRGIIPGLLFYAILFSPFWLSYIYFKLNKSNKVLSKLCGDTKVISFTIPTETILSHQQWSAYKKQGLVLKKTKLGWFYSPDITAKWLGNMENEGFNLIRMSKLGNSFYFINGTQKKVKYHVDFQVKKSASYLAINVENGWKLFFTSFTRYFAITVWSQAYEKDMPNFYSNYDDEVSHAKKFMLTYASIYIPLGMLYASMTFIFGYTLWSIIPEFGMDKMLISVPIIFLLSSILYFYYTFKVVRYYYRIKG